jgi:hypothetical protein
MATVRTQSGLRIDADEFGALFRELQQVDKKLANEVKKRLRNEAKPLVRAMQKAVTDPQSKRSANISQIKNRTRTVRGVDFDGSETRERITEARTIRTTTSKQVAAGIGFRMGTGKSPFVRFAASGSKLPPARRAMAKALNKKSFRHPVFGDRTAPWVEQAGRPYFGAVILDERERLLEAINKAMDEIAEKVGRSRIRG